MDQSYDVVCLCAAIDLKSHFEAVFRTHTPWLRLLRPDEVDTPQRIRFALGWRPAAGSFTRFPCLQMVTSIGAGADGILACADLPDDLLVSRIKNTEQAAMMSGFALWNVIGLHREMAHYQVQQRRSQWRQRSKAPPSRFTVGILGYGLMGQHLAKSLRHLGYPVHAAARTAASEVVDGISVHHGPQGVMRVASTSQALINMLPLTAATHGILNAALFDAMPSKAWLIQLGRGAHLVESELLEALDNNIIGGAALDVFAHEPLPEHDPLWHHPRVRITPHVASEADDRVVAQWLAEEIRRLDNGQPILGTIDRNTGY